MKVIDNDLLDEFRQGHICELCNQFVARVEPHHIFARGRSGAFRLDVRINLVALCAAFSGGRGCHQLAHDGKIDRAALLAIVARREKRSVEEIEEEIYRMRRA